MANLLAVTDVITGYIIPFIIILSLIVFVHEMGHYLAGRWCGIRITAFSLGFGPEIIGFDDRHGTRWKLSAIPLGGYVKFFGDEDASSKPDLEGLERMSAEERAVSFQGAALWKRTVAVAAGPLANFILAIFIFAAMFMIYGKPVTDPVVAEVAADSAAEDAGLAPGDIIVSLDGTSIETFSDIQRYVSIRPGVGISVGIDRKGETITVEITPRSTELTDRFGNKMEVGVLGVMTNQDAGHSRVIELGPVEAVGEGITQSWHIVSGTFRYIGNVITGRMKADQIGGPVRVAQAAGQMASLGFSVFLQYAAVISVSIGLINLMPVPVLDGGHLMFYAVEAVRGRPLGPVAQDIAFKIGLVLVLSLMVFATWNDIARNLT